VECRFKNTGGEPGDSRVPGQTHDTDGVNIDDVAVGARYSTLFVSSFNVFDEKTPLR
jgi:hypothetical protein